MGNKEKKLNRKRAKGKKNSMSNKEPSGFNKKTKVPKAILDMFSNVDRNEEMARTAVTKLIYDYIKEHGLQDKQDRRIIHPDNKLKTLFDLRDDDQLSFK